MALYTARGYHHGCLALFINLDIKTTRNQIQLQHANYNSQSSRSIEHSFNMKNHRTAANLVDTPTELLNKIFQHLSLPDFLALAHTHPRLRAILKENSATIFNQVIRTRFSKLVQMLDAQLVDGWLVPQHTMMEVTANKFGGRCYSCYTHLRLYTSEVPCTSRYVCSQKSDTKPPILMSAPGPQFLVLLESILFRKDLKYYWDDQDPLEHIPGSHTEFYKSRFDHRLRGHVYSMLKDLNRGLGIIEYAGDLPPKTCPCGFPKYGNEISAARRSMKNVIWYFN